MNGIIKEHFMHFIIGFNESREMRKQSVAKRWKIGERNYYIDSIASKPRSTS